jgi:Cyclic GMP-AMP synthase DncV-like, nucleotidyltransferase domain
MANLQKQMNDFHDKIRLKGFEKNERLKDKRDLLLKNLRDKLNSDDEDPKLFFKEFNQGSYAMHTGVKPFNSDQGEFDIDVGLAFDLNSEKHQTYIDNPVKLKERVLKALNHPSRTIKVKRPCVTVSYAATNSESAYHVDLACYMESSSIDGLLDLAKGKINSTPEEKKWETNDPKGLIEKINNRFSGEDEKESRHQMRRVIRMFKRWRDKQSLSKPISIALTCDAYNRFQPVQEHIPGSGTQPNDQQAFLILVSNVLNSAIYDRIESFLIVHPGGDLNDSMTDNQMETYISKLENLQEGLQQSIDLACPHEAAKKLRNQLGDDFDVPSKEDTAQKAATAIGTTGANA